MQQLTCPACGFRGDPEAFLTEAANARALLTALRLPETLAEALAKYVRLHNPPRKAMAAAKRERLLADLLERLTGGEVTRNGVTYAAPRALWAAVLGEITEQPPADLPLDGHGYLDEIVWRRARSAAGQAEQRREQQLRTPAAHAPRAAAVITADGTAHASGADARANWAERQASGREHARSIKHVLRGAVPAAPAQPPEE